MTTRSKKTAGRPGFGGVGDAFTASPRVVFAPSNYTQIPNAVIDEYMAVLSGAEYKVLTYIARRTFGFHRQTARVSAAQLCAGLTLRDGRRLDYGTGLSRTQVFAAVKGLEEKGYIAVRRSGNVVGESTTSNTYTLWVEGVNGEPVMGDEGGPYMLNSTPRAKNERGGQYGNRIGPRAENAPPYREGKKGGKKAPLSPMGNGKEKENTAAPSPAPCATCSGYGLLDSGTPTYWPHVNTLEAVRYFVLERGARYCGCAVGQGWRTLMEDAAKGDGPRKGAGTMGTMGATGGKGKRA